MFQLEDAEKQYFKFLCDNINYPTIAAENGITGKIIASYIINENGKVEDIEAEVSVDPSLAKEVIRAIKTFPDWIPGKQNGKNVPVQCYMIAEFRIKQ